MYVPSDVREDKIRGAGDYKFAGKISNGDTAKNIRIHLSAIESYKRHHSAGKCHAAILSIG